MTSPIERAREAIALAEKATKPPWKWSAATGDVQLEGSDEYPEMNPILVARGCGNKKPTEAGVEGCMPEHLGDPLRSCPLHPHKADRDLIAHAGTHYREIATALLSRDAEVARLRELVKEAHIALGADGGITEIECSCEVCKP